MRLRVPSSNGRPVALPHVEWSRRCTRGVLRRTWPWATDWCGVMRRDFLEEHHVRSDRPPPRAIVSGCDCFPVAISSRTAPKENRSVRGSTSSPRTCSGDMYAAVPIAAPATVRYSDAAVAVRAACSAGVSPVSTAGTAVLQWETPAKVGEHLCGAHVLADNREGREGLPLRGKIHAAKEVLEARVGAQGDPCDCPTSATLTISC